MHYNKIFKLIICAISTLFLVACASNEITQTKTETTVELGSEPHGESVSLGTTRNERGERVHTEV